MSRKGRKAAATAKRHTQKSSQRRINRRPLVTRPLTEAPPATITHVSLPAPAVSPCRMDNLVRHDEQGGVPRSFDVAVLDARFAPMKPFPVDALPDCIKDYVVASSKSLDCDPASIALPVLSVLASAIGGCQTIQLKPDWAEPPTLWTAVLADPSRQPPLRQATAPLDDCQRGAYLDASADDSDDGQLPKPIHRFVARHWHLPTLLKTLAGQDRGLLLCTDQLEGWLGTGRTSARRSVELATWQDLHAGEAVLAPSSPKQPPQPVIHKSLCLTGTLSPSLLVDKLARSRTPCSLISRTLIAMPPTRPRRWTDDEVSEDTEAVYAATVQNLLTLDANPGWTVLSDDAKHQFANFLNDIQVRQSAHNESVAPWLANIPTQAARLALIIHLTRWAESVGCASAQQNAKQNMAPEDRQLNTLPPRQSPVPARACDGQSMQMALTLANWFAEEGVRVLSQLTIAADNKDHQHLIEWALRKGGTVSARDLSRSQGHKYPTSEQANQALNELVEAGFGHWLQLPPGEKGGPNHQVFVLGQPENSHTSDSPAIEETGAEAIEDSTEAMDELDHAPLADCDAEDTAIDSSRRTDFQSVRPSALPGPTPA